MHNQGEHEGNQGSPDGRIHFPETQDGLFFLDNESQSPMTGLETLCAKPNCCADKYLPHWQVHYISPGWF
jgi:hypothetical protein